MNKIVYLWNFKPNESKPFPDNVISHNSNYIPEYCIITPSDIDSFLDDDLFPELSDLYFLIPHWVIKSDLVRLLILYFYGGFYFDADCYIQKIFDKHSANDNVILFIEWICPIETLGPRENKHPDNQTRIANYCFGCNTKKHPFLKEVIDECISRLKQILIVENKTVLDQQDILWVCGPDVITTVYHRSKHNYTDIFLYDQTYLAHMNAGSWR
jgi:mannosyltransferase OCH1-like enzyme